MKTLRHLLFLFSLLALHYSAVAQGFRSVPARSHTAADSAKAKKQPEKKATAKKDADKKETVKKEPVKKDAAKKELAKKEPVKKNAPKKEAAKKETSKKEPAKKAIPKGGTPDHNKVIDKKFATPEIPKLKHKGKHNVPPVNVGAKNTKTKKSTKDKAKPKKPVKEVKPKKPVADTVKKVVEKPVPHEKWNMTLKKKPGGMYQLVFHLDLDKGWHVFVKNKTLPKTITAAVFTFDNNPAITLSGETVSKGIRSAKKIESVGTVDVYDYKVLYEQDFSAKPGAVISGKYTYQVCNDKMAVPAVTKKFRFVVK